MPDNGTIELAGALNGALDLDGQLDGTIQVPRDGEDGFSPVVTVTDITGGHRVTITDADGTNTVDVMDGVDGIDGTDGTDGVSPTVSVSNITGGHSITITDADGTHFFNVMDGTKGTSATIQVTDITGGHRLTIRDASGTHTVDVMDGEDGQDGQDGAPGQDGADGVSPAVTATEITGGHQVSVTDANGTTTFNVMDGEDGATGAQGPAGPGVPSGGTTGQVLKKATDSDYETEWETLSIPEDKLFVAVYGTTSLSDIATAYNAGKILICKYNSDTYAFLIDNLPPNFIFAYVTPYNNVLRKLVRGQNGWSTEDTILVDTARTINDKALSTNITLDSSDVGAIAAPSSPTVGDFLVYTSNGWAAQSLSTWSGGNY